MKLSEFLSTRAISQTKFAEMIGVRQAAISRYVGGRMPRREHLLSIRQATDGAVTADDFLPAEAAE